MNRPPATPRNAMSTSSSDYRQGEVVKDGVGANVTVETTKDSVGANVETTKSGQISPISRWMKQISEQMERDGKSMNLITEEFIDFMKRRDGGEGSISKKKEGGVGQMEGQRKQHGGKTETNMKTSQKTGDEQMENEHSVRLVFQYKLIKKNPCHL